MALTMGVTTSHGIELSAAYIRIDEQSGGKDTVNLRVRTYVNVENCAAGKPWIGEEIYSFSPSVEDNSDNFLKQGYEYLKTLPEFEVAADVLE